MELSPKLYHYFVRPQWFSNIFYDKMFHDLIDFRGKTVLDFGCGVGSSSFLFEPSAYHGVDCDGNRIEYAKNCILSIILWSLKLMGDFRYQEILLIML